MSARVNGAQTSAVKINRKMTAQTAHASQMQMQINLILCSVAWEILDNTSNLVGFFTFVTFDSSTT